MGSAYENVENKVHRDPLSTHDINGGVKKNQFGQKMYLDANRDPNAYAGQVKPKKDKFENNYENVIPSTYSKNRSQVFDHIDPSLEKMYQK